MAEFAEVMLRTTQICESMPSCDACPLYIRDGHDDHMCPLLWRETLTVEHFQRAEKIVMDWAMKHPFTPYPTWEEWRIANFPRANGKLNPCHFMTTSEWYDISGCTCEDCSKCRSRPIPAYIAKKLGIKPQGASA